MSFVILPPNRTANSTFKLSSVKIGPAVGPARVIKKKNRTQKCHKGVIIHLLGKKTPDNRFALKFALWLPFPQ